jgi:hypothetical protein
MWLMDASGSAVRAQPTAATAVPAGANEASRGRVLLLDEAGQPPQDGLLLALRIQLGDGAVVETRVVPEGLARSGRTQAAAELRASEGAHAVVWTERSQGAPPGEAAGLTFLVLRAGSGNGPDALDAHRVAGSPGPDLDRTIALKVSEILEQSQATSTPTEGSLADPAGVGPRPGDALAGVVAAPAWRLGLLAQLGALAAPVGGTGFGRWGPVLGAGASLRRDRLRFAALAELTWLPTASRADASARLEVQELAPALRLSAQTALGPVWLGAYAAVACSVLQAEATNAAGVVDDETELSASWLAGLGLELPLVPALGLGLELGAQGRLRRQRFTVEQRELADSGSLRPTARLVLSFRPGEPD